MKSSRRKAIQAKIKADLIENNGKVCFFCGQWTEGITLVHIIRQSYSTTLSIVPGNCLLGCMECHRIFDDESSTELRALKNLDGALEIMEALDFRYYNRFMDKVNK